MRRVFGLTARLPKIISIDRATGMYTSHGFIVRDYEFALSDVGLKHVWGADVSSQAPDGLDVLLRETDVGMSGNLCAHREVCGATLENNRGAKGAAR